MKRKKKKGRWLMATGMLCIAAALSLTAYYLLTEHQSDQAARDVLIQLNQQIVHETPRQEDNTAGLIISDQDGHEIDWPMQEGGMPMPWPVDHDGKPQPRLTDAFENVYIWHYELNMPVRDTSGEGSGQTPAPEAAQTEPPAAAEVPAPMATTLPAAYPTASPESELDDWKAGIVLPTEAASPTQESGDSGLQQNEGMLNPGDYTDPSQDASAQHPALNGGEGTGKTYTWTADPSGNLLPYASDGLGQVIPWMTDQAGKALRLELLSQLWQLLLKQLNANLQQFLSKPAFVLNPDMEMPVTTLKGHDYIGILDIPCQNVSLPVMSEWSYAKLKIAPCRYSGSVYSGDVILAGHNSNGHFSPIKKLVIGDEVRFTDADGNVFIYSVMRIDVLGANDVQDLLAGDEEWDLSMFTCSHNSRKRTTVRCKLESYIAAKK